MDLVTGALGKLPSKLLELLSDEYKLQTGVKDQIRRLTRELESMHAALRKVAQVPPDELDEQVLLWARDVREASYDMEDILDTFLVRVDGDPMKPPDANKVKRLVKKMGNLFSLSRGKARHEIAGAIDALSKQLEEVAKLRGRYTVDDIVPKPAAKTSIDPRLSSLYTKVSQLVGINDQRDKVMQMLTEGGHDMQPNHETKIVSVVGVGGLGKTTLVKAVYDKLTIDIHFKAFVPIGQNPDLKKALRDILIDLDKQRYTTVFYLTIMDERQLIDELRDFLKDKRYFIVIDDVWDIESWKIIRNALDDNSLGSKIVITTRKQDVAKEVRRLSLQNTAWPTMEMSKLRSIAIFSSAKFNSMPSLSCCPLLRVLDLQGCNLRDHPSLRFVGNLFHLRYLSLEGTGYGGELPVEIGKLQFLQTLELWDTLINELPSSIVGLRQLIGLYGNMRTRLPNGLRCLTLLEELIQVSVDSACMAEELGHLTQLRKLCVRLKKDKDGRWDENLCTAFVRSLAKLHKIKELVVYSNDVAADLQEGSVESLQGNLSYLYINGATSLPTWISRASLPLVSCLEIRMVKVRRDDIRVLGMLQALRFLQVVVSGEVQVLERFAVSTDAFPCAIKCTFVGFSMAPSAFPRGAMPRLEEFTFSIRLEDFAVGGQFTGDDLALGHLPSLQRVHVELCGKEGVSEEVVMEVEERLRHEVDALLCSSALNMHALFRKQRSIDHPAEEP